MALTRSTDPLVWIDCEMTGLNPATDTIMSISCILTTSDLSPLDNEGFDAVIQHTPSQLSTMSEWCTRTHGASGLTRACVESTTTAPMAARALVQYVQRYIPEPRRALLAGNSIHADKMFLMVPPWNVILDHLHYRLFDVSATKEMVRRWASPTILENAPVKQLKHTAREDILESLTEARYYRKLIEGMSPPPNDVLTGHSRGATNMTEQASVSSNLLASAAGSAPGRGFVSGAPAPSLNGGASVGATTAQDEWDMQKLNSTSVGGTNTMYEGFRTDVP
ncbi:Phosphatidylinositol 3,4,5-trisphosphate-dependent Rac exchanger 2 protein [Rhinocladiella similis]